MSVRTRFAPSPTGYLHIGGIRTALYAWLHAKQHEGAFILRIEDTDKEREVEGSIGHIMQSLKWLGIEWDEGPDIGGPYAPYLQSDRLAIYKEYAQRLVAAGHAYPDPYTEEQLETWRKEAEEAHLPFLFRDHRPTETQEWDGTTPLRFKVPTIKRFEWHDIVRGPLSAGEEALDDFILVKGDGYPTYNFAHVVDDIEMQITHVIRGDEFISSTPKFLSLYEALGVNAPLFATMPPILGPDGKKKLSKRDGAKDLLDYRAEGYLPEAMVNYLALLGWHPTTEQELFSRDQLLKEFDLNRVQKSGAHFDETKLLSVNQHWMRTLPDEDFLTHLDVARLNLAPTNYSRVVKAVPLLKERAQTFSEAQQMLTDELGCLFTRPTLTANQLVAKEPADASGVTKTYLTELAELMQQLPETPSAEEVKNILMPYADEKGRGAVLWPLRYALSGREKSPDPFTLVHILGRDEAVERVRLAHELLS